MTDKSFIALEHVVEELSSVQSVFNDVLRLDLLVFDTTELINISDDVYAAEKRLREFLEGEVVD